MLQFTVKAGCKLNVEVGNSSAETKFTWNDVNNATGYDVKIWKGKVWEGDPYLVEWGASNPYSVVLPEGTYQAYVDTRFGSDMQMSNIVTFNVTKAKNTNWRPQLRQHPHHRRCRSTPAIPPTGTHPDTIPVADR